MKNNADALIFHTAICAEAAQIALMHRAKTALLLFARASSAKRFGMEINMHIIVNSSSMIPIYEQIMDQIKTAVLAGELKEGDGLPSVRGLSKDLKISALTVKKAYDNLEQDGFTVTVHGKGTFVAAVNPQLLREENQKDVEEDLERVIQKAGGCGMTQEELRILFEIIMEGYYAENK